MASLIGERNEGTALTGFGGGDEDSWTESIGSGCSATTLLNSSALGFDPPGWGLRCIRLIRDTTGWDARRWKTVSAITGVAYWDFQVAVLQESLADNESVNVCRLVNNTSGNTVAAVLLLQDGSGNLLWRLSSRESGDAGAFTTTNGPAVALSTVYRHQLLYDFDGARLIWYVDGAEHHSATGITPADEVSQFLIGTGSGDTQRRTSIVYDRMFLDDEHWPDEHHPRVGKGTTFVLNGEVDVAAAISREEQASLDRVLAGDPDSLSLTLQDAENRLIRTEELDNTGDWVRTNLNDVGAGASDPEGDNDAFTLEESTATDVHRLQQGGVPIIAGTAFTAACWVFGPPGIRNYEIILFESTGNTIFAKFDLQNGTVQSSGDAGNGVLVGATIKAEGVWHRVTLTGYFTSGSTVTWMHSLLDTSFNRIYTGNLIGNFPRVWNPQMTRGGPQQARFDLPTDANPYQYGPQKLDTVSLSVDWYEADGAFWGTVEEFAGTVVRANKRTVAVDPDGRGKLNRYEIECAGPAWELGEEFFDLIINDGPVEDAAQDIIDLVSSKGFTLDVHADVQGTTIAGDTFAFTSPISMLDEICRRAGCIYRVHIDKRVELFIPGTRKLLPWIDLDKFTGAVPRQPTMTWSEDASRIANTVRVQGDGILVTASSAGTTRHAPLFNAEGMTSIADATRVAQALLNGLESAIINTDIPTWNNEVDPGMQAVVLNRDWNVVEQETMIRQVTMTRGPGGIWLASCKTTTEELVSAVGILEPEPADPRPGDPLPGTEFFLVNGPIETPNAARPTPASDEVIVHLRFNAAEGTVGRWRVEWEAGSGVGGVGGNYSADMFFRHEATMTVSAGAPQADGTEDFLILHDGTRNVRVTTARSGANDFWQLEVGGHDVLFADPSVLGGTLFVGLFFKDAWIDKIASITVGGRTIGTDVSTGNIIRIEMPVDPSTPLEAGVVTSAELADGAVEDAKIVAGRSLVESGSVDANKKVNKIRKSGVDVAADDVLDRTNDTSDDVPEGTNKKFVGSGGGGDADDLPETATRKWAAEAGADVTSANTAAAITGQGALATKETVATADIDANAVTGPKIATGAVDSDQLAVESILTGKLALNAVKAARVGDNAVGGNHFAESVIDEFVNMGSGLSDSEWDSKAGV